MSVYGKIAETRYEAQYPGCRNSDGSWKTAASPPREAHIAELDYVGDIFADPGDNLYIVTQQDEDHWLMVPLGHGHPTDVVRIDWTTLQQHYRPAGYCEIDKGAPA